MTLRAYPEEMLGTPGKQVLILSEGQEVPDSIRHDTSARFWTLVRMPDGTEMSVEDWEKNHAPNRESVSVTPIDPNYLPTNADFGFPATWRNFRTADFFAEKLGISIEEVQRLYREEKEKFYQLIDAQGLRIKVKSEDL